MEMGVDSIFLGSKITVDKDGTHEIKRHLLLGRKSMTNLDSIFRSRYRRRRGQQRMRLWDGITDSVDMISSNISQLQETVMDREAWHAAVCGAVESDTTR